MIIDTEHINRVPFLKQAAHVVLKQIKVLLARPTALNNVFYYYYLT